MFSLIFLILSSSYLFFLFYSKAWILVVILLLYLGGVLILFLYLTSLNPKKNFLKNKSFFLFFLFIPLVRVFFKKFSLSWFSLKISLLFFSYSENFILLFFILLFFILFLFFISYNLINIFLPFRNL